MASLKKFGIDLQKIRDLNLRKTILLLFNRIDELSSENTKLHKENQNLRDEISKNLILIRMANTLRLYVFNIKTFKILITIIYLFIISIIIPFTYHNKYGYTIIDKEGFYLHKTSLANDNNTQIKLIKYMYENIKNLKTVKLYVNNPDPKLNFPIYQYYNFGPYLITSLLLFIFNNYNIVYIYSYIIPLFLASLGCYLISIKYNPKTKYISPLLFVLSPYMIVDILERNAFSEVWAFSLLPLLFWLLESLFDNFRLSYFMLWVLLSSIFLTSHNITILYSLVLYSVYFIYKYIKYYKFKKQIIKIAILTTLTPFMLTSFYLIPIFQNNKDLIIALFFGNPNSYAYVSSLATIFSLSPKLGVNLISNLPIQIGLPLILTICLIIKKKKIYQLFVVLLLIIFISFPVWDIMPGIFKAIQFPYRLMAILVFLLMIFFSKLYNNKVIYLVIFILTIITGYLYLNFKYDYTDGRFSYNTNYRNAWYYYKSLSKYPKNNVSLKDFISKSTSLKLLKNVHGELNPPKDIYTIDCEKEDCYGSIFINLIPKKGTRAKDELFVYALLNYSDSSMNDTEMFRIKEKTNVYSFCPSSKVKSINIIIVNNGKKPYNLNEISIYKAALQNRPVQINESIYPSTCDFNKGNNFFSSTFPKNTLGKFVLIPYYYSNENILTQDNHLVKESEPARDIDNRPYIMARNKSLQPFIVTDSFFPISIIKRIKYNFTK